ncbi:hypothetical protein K9N68_23425 [Kovacikia minuta CCNUW1]|uniref:hypothetical protein n=1 Tax=Kovacikia minuta TaxID=2931930 RepID=UPI001CCC4A66|nr:hypothetical protein [Kovacikia minuta]UBF24606.1 hypothetical protein K9N68_23425 [Kovacikia minuta CCNUW1]
MTYPVRRYFYPISGNAGHMGSLLLAVFKAPQPTRGVAIASLLFLVSCSKVDLEVFQVTSSPTQPASPAVPSVQQINDRSLVQTIPLSETLVIPGERVGPVTRNTSREELSKMFGTARLHDRTLSDPEGMDTYPATTVDLGSKQSFTVIWKDATQTRPAYVRDLGSDWQTPEGISIGTSFADLRKQLGEFQLYGLDWDYGGSVTLLGTKLSQYYGKLTLQVKADPNAAKKFPKDYRAVIGDRRFSSTNPHWKRLGMHIAEITVVLN